MAKSKSQRMKEYRQRQKEKYGKAWDEKERDRVKANYVPVDLLTQEEKIARREKNRAYAKSFYQKHKKGPSTNKQTNGENELNVEVGGVSEPVASTSTEIENEVYQQDKLTVKLPFTSNNPSRENGPKKRQSRALQRSYRRIETLEDQNESLKKKLKSVQKRLQRVESTKHMSPKTPRSKTDKLLKRSGIEPTSVPEIRKKLVYVECLNEEIRSLATDKCSEVSKLHRIVSGRIVKKYRMKAYMEKMTMFERRRVSKESSDKKRALRATAEKLKTDVHLFLNRDDNSRVMPGKGDYVKDGKAKKQKRILNDYMHNLHLKFLSESNYKISRATFYRLRPKELSLVNFSSRSVCLCAKHQNMSFKLKSLNNMKVSTRTSPDSFVDLYGNTPDKLEEMLEKISDECVRFQQWKRVKLNNGKERMRIVDIEQTKDTFISTFKKEFVEFVKHVKRVAAQYKGVKSMKENLPKDHMLIQMDFSENYSCQTMEEIQSAYWNSPMVTLHPTVIYFNDDNNDNLQHKSMVFVSEVLHHNASMVAAIITITVAAVKKIKPDVKYVHFWTDSPSSQYRNRSIFDLLCSFKNDYGLNATWHYFECGHGKSACDGVGGTAKRNADMAVKQSKAVIQDATDFFAWAVSSHSEIEYQLITPEEYEKSDHEIQKRKSIIKPLKGTMLLHSIATDSNTNALLVRETTCACKMCFGENGFNGDSSCKWDRVELKYIEPKSQIDTNEQGNNTGTSQVDNVINELEHESKIEEKDFVVAKYDDKCYIGQVMEVDNSDDSVHVSFMVGSGKALGRFKWPTKRDVIWVDRENVLRQIDAPEPTGKGGRMFQVPSNVIDFMELNSK